MNDKAGEVMEPGGRERYPLCPLENTTEPHEDVPDFMIDVQLVKLWPIVMKRSRVQLPLRNGRYPVSNTGVVLSFELGMAHDKHRYPSNL
jgi:hypothetical protein